MALGFLDMALVKAAASWGGDWDAADELQPLLAVYADEAIAVGEEWELEDVVISDLMRRRDRDRPDRAYGRARAPAGGPVLLRARVDVRGHQRPAVG